MRRILGSGHRDTLVMSGNLAISLPEQGKHAESMEIEREVLAQKTRLLGAEHERTLIAATNLAVSLSNCGQCTEAGQLFRDTPAASLSALGPSHELAQRLTGQVRTLDARRNVFFWMSGCLAVFLVGLAYCLAA